MLLHPLERRDPSGPAGAAIVGVFRRLPGWEVVGYLGMERVLDEGYIDNVAVFPAHRRKGVASALLGALIAYGEKEGMAFLTLEVRPSNQGARALYEAHGFQQVGERKNFYQNPVENALLLTRYLDE